MHHYKKLNVWQDSVEFAADIYRVTASYPKQEKYGITMQIRRSAVSIGSNIAEGAGRSSNKEFIRFLDIATGSAFELETQLIISKKLQLISDSHFDKLMDSLTKIQKMIYRLQQSIT